MNGSKLARWAPLTGVIFSVMTAAAILIGQPDSPEFAGPPDDFLRYYTENKSAVLSSSVIGVVSVLFLLWFLGTVSSILRRAEGDEGRVALIGVIGGAVGAGAWLGGMAANVMPALRLDEQGSISVDLATAFGDLSNILAGVAAPVGFGTLLLATALIGLRTKRIPVWLTWLSLVFGLVMEVPWISFLGIFGFPVWVLIVAVLELTKGADAIRAPSPATA